MFRKKETTIFTGVDIGSNTLKAAMGQDDGDGMINLLALEEIPCQYICKGEIQNVNAVSEHLSHLLNKLEKSAGKYIDSISLAISGKHIGSINIQGSTPILSSTRLISQSDIHHSLQYAKSQSLPIDQVALHIFKRQFIIDDSQRTSQPLGMSGNKLTVDLHCIYTQKSTIQTLKGLLENVTDFSDITIVFSGVADFYSLEIKQKQPNGVLVIDIGAGVTDYILLYKDGCMHSGQITIGCDHIANDLAIAFQLSIDHCRDIFKHYANALPNLSTNEHIQIETFIGDPSSSIKLSLVHKVVEARISELFQILKEQLKSHKVLNMIGEHIVICGGGALIPKLDTFTKALFKVPVKIGAPENISNLSSEQNSPRYITLLGLLQLAHEQKQMQKDNELSLRALLKRDVINIFRLCKESIRI